MIRTEGLTKRYAALTAVDGISFQARPGEVVGLLGPNGAGKTTTVEILEAYRPRDGGRVSVLGLDPAQATSEWRSRIGIVLQEAGDNADLSCVEVLRAFATFYPSSRSVDEVLGLVGLSEQAEARVRVLSGGQRRRLDVGLGIIGRPELLFLDEPTTGFDAEARRQFWSMIRGLRAEGTTIVLTTHYLDEAEELADDVAVIADGEIKAQGPPATIGGRDDAAALVRCRLEDGSLFEQRTATPATLVASLQSLHGELPELTITRPSLEEIYLALIRDEEDGS